MTRRQRRQIEHSPRFIERTRKRRIKVAIAGTVLTLCVLVGGWFLVHAERLQVTTVHVVGAVTVPSDAIREVVQKQLGGAYAFVIPRSFAPVVPIDDIETSVLTHDLRLRTVEARRTGFTTLKVAVTERASSIRWCGSRYASSTPEGTCYVSDGNGFIFMRDLGRQEMRTMFAPISTSTLSREGSAVGTVIMDRSLFQKSLEIADALAVLDLSPNAIAISGEHEWRFYQPAGWYLMLDPQSDIVRALSDTVTALRDRERREPDRLSVLRYIDARFAGKIVFQFDE